MLPFFKNCLKRKNLTAEEFESCQCLSMYKISNITCAVFPESSNLFYNFADTKRVKHNSRNTGSGECFSWFLTFGKQKYEIEGTDPNETSRFYCYDFRISVAMQSVHSSWTKGSLLSILIQETSDFAFVLSLSITKMYNCF